MPAITLDVRLVEPACRPALRVLIDAAGRREVYPALIDGAMCEDVEPIKARQRLLHAPGSVLKLVAGAVVLLFSEVRRLHLHPEEVAAEPCDEVNAILLRRRDAIA